MIKSTMILCIKGYQRFLSPRKGYRCAHSVLHGDSGCSGAVIDILKNNSLLKCWSLIKQRFANCKSANITLIEQRKKKKSNHCECGGDGSACDGFVAGYACSSCTNDCDVGDCDIGSCDF